MTLSEAEIVIATIAQMRGDLAMLKAQRDELIVIEESRLAHMLRFEARALEVIARSQGANILEFARAKP